MEDQNAKEKHGEKRSRTMVLEESVAGVRVFTRKKREVKKAQIVPSSMALTPPQLKGRFVLPLFAFYGSVDSVQTS